MPHLLQVRELYGRLDAAEYWCSSRKGSFGLPAYVALVTAWRSKVEPRRRWRDLEGEDRATELETLVSSCYLPSNAPTMKRHFAATGAPGALSGTRGEAMVAGGREAVRKRLVQDREAYLRKKCKHKKTDWEKAETELHQFLEDKDAAAAMAGQSAPREAGATAQAPAKPGRGQAAQARAAAAAAAAAVQANPAASADARARKPRAASRPRPDSDGSEEEYVDEEEDDDEMDMTSGLATRERLPVRKASKKARAAFEGGESDLSGVEDSNSAEESMSS